MKFFWTIIIGITVFVGGYFYLVSRDDFQVPSPDADGTSTFTVPLPQNASVFTIPVEADLSALLSDAKAQMSNPLAQASEVVNVPTQLHLELFATRTVLKEVTKFEDKIEQETRRECERSEQRCSKVERRVEKICRDVPWPLSEVCDAVEKTVCIATEATCVAWKTVVVSTKVVKVPVQVLEEVEETFVDIVDKVADLDAEVDYTVNFVDLDANLNGQSLQGFVDVDYKVKLNARLNGLEGKIKLAEVNGLTSCGYDEPMRRLRMNFSANLNTLESAALSLENLSWSLEWINACQLTAFDIQLEDLLDLPLVKKAVKKAIDKALDKAIGKANDSLRFQTKLSEIWPDVRKPINLGQTGWVSINPESIALAPVSGEGKTVRTVASILAHPVISNDKPTPSGPAIAPQAKLGTTKPGIVINLAAGVSFDFVKLQISNALKDLAPDFVSISEVDAYASMGQLVLSVYLETPVKGKIYVIGKPSLHDNGTQVTFPEIDFSALSKNALLEVADQFFHDKLRSLLRKAAVLNFSSERDAALKKYETMQIPLDDNGSRLSLSVSSARVDELRIMSQGLYAIFRLEGDADTSIKP